MLSLVRDKPPQVFWKIFLKVWSVCDCTWNVRDAFLDLLKNASARIPAASYLSEDARELLQNLPADLLVFRGCSRTRVNGLSWSIDPVKAMEFAVGHRSIPVPDPVLVTAKIKRKDIFAVMTERGESEIICAPSKILSIDRRLTG
jgi:hypothetical protein